MKQGKEPCNWWEPTRFKIRILNIKLNTGCHSSEQGKGKQFKFTQVSLSAQAFSRGDSLVKVSSRESPTMQRKVGDVGFDPGSGSRPGK